MKANNNRRTQFEIFKGLIDESGKFEKTRLAGLAFLREGKLEYRLKIFSQITNRLYAVPDDGSSDKYKIFVRDDVLQKYGKSKSFWCEVGEGRVLARLGLIEVKVDLWSEPLYMSIFPRDLPKLNLKPIENITDLKLVA